MADAGEAHRLMVEFLKQNTHPQPEPELTLTETTGNKAMTDWKALCAELLEALENAIRVVYHEDGTKHISTADPVIAKADAALAQPEPEGHQAIAKRAIESCLAQRDEVLAAFITKYGFQPEDAIQVEQLQSNGTSTWRIERRPGPPKPEELRDEDLEATARAAEIQPEPGEVAELVRRLRDWQSIPLLEERERAATLLQQLSTIEDLKND
jgi:hypothetical protein